MLHLFEVNERKSARLAAVETAKTLSALSPDLRLLDLDPPKDAPTSWPAVSAWAVDEAERLRAGSSSALGPFRDGAAPALRSVIADGKRARSKRRAAK